MPISFQPANKAELRVEVGKTSLDQLQQFQADAAGKGGGQIRAKANEDGSYTLYVPADTKIRLSGLASALGFKGYGQTERTQKQDLAKDLVKEILSRRLPQEGLAPGATTARTLRTTVGRGGEGAQATNRWKDSVGERTAALLSNIDQFADNITSLGNRLKEAEGISAAQTTGLGRKVDSTPYRSLDRIMNQPHMRAAFGRYMKECNVGENFDFMCQVDALKQATTPQAKLAIAREIVADRLPAGPNSGRAAGDEAINISAKLTGIIEQEVSDLASRRPLSPDDLTRLDNAFDDALKVVKGFIPEKQGNIQPMSIAGFMASERFQEGLGAIGADQAHAKLGASADAANTVRTAVMGYEASGQLGRDVETRLQEMIPARSAEFENRGTFENALARPAIHDAFMTHQGTEFSTENLQFYDQTKSLSDRAAALPLAPGGADGRSAVNRAALQQLADAAQVIVNTFVAASSEAQVNLPNATGNAASAGATIAALAKLQQGIAELEYVRLDHPTAGPAQFAEREQALKQGLATLFQPAQKEIINLMHRDSGSRFQAKSEFSQAIVASVKADTNAVTATLKLEFQQRLARDLNIEAMDLPPAPLPPAQASAAAPAARAEAQEISGAATPSGATPPAGNYEGSEAVSRLFEGQLQARIERENLAAPTAASQPAASGAPNSAPLDANYPAEYQDLAPNLKTEYRGFIEVGMSPADALAAVLRPEANAPRSPAIAPAALRSMVADYAPTAQSAIADLHRTTTAIRDSNLSPFEKNQLTATANFKWEVARGGARAVENQQRKTVFDAALSGVGLRPFEAGGGGHCMFHSMAHQLNGTTPAGLGAQAAIRTNLLARLATLTPAQQAFVTDARTPADITAGLAELTGVLQRGIAARGDGDSGIWGDKGHARLLAVQTGRPVVLVSYLEKIQVFNPLTLSSNSFETPAAADLAGLMTGRTPAIGLYHTGGNHWQSMTTTAAAAPSRTASTAPTGTPPPDTAVLDDLAPRFKAAYNSLILNQGMSPSDALKAVLSDVDNI